MDMSYSEKKYQRKILLGKKDDHLILLMAICMILFVVLAFIKAIWYVNYPEKAVAQNNFINDVMYQFTLPASFTAFTHRPWTLLTNMFVANNNDFWKVFPQMLWLWSFGYIMQDIMGRGKLVPVFIYGGLAGSVSFMLFYNFLPSLQPAMQFATLGGLSCGIIAVAVVITMVSPKYRLFPMIGGGIPLWVLTAVFLVSDFATVSIADTGTLLTHISAAIVAVLFTFFLHRGYDWSGWMNQFFDWVNNLFQPGKKAGNSSFRDELFYNASTEPYTKTAKITQQRVDEILDKIGQQGYDRLTDEEKELLKRASREGVK